MSDLDRMLLGFRAGGAGGRASASGGTDGPVTLDPGDLTTHAVCLGATGSGKTGLMIALLEEASLAGVPVIALDLKGDLTNLALVFPELGGADFRPWIEPDAARRSGVTVDAMAQEVAERWRSGLEADGVAPDRRRRLRASREIRLFTPGSDAGRPINLVDSLDLPEPHVLASEETLAEAVSGTASALLGLLGLEVEPLRSREHVLVSTVIQNAWSAGRSLDLEELISEIVTPPFPRVGVFTVDRFMTRREREGLALSFNALIAAPGFALWGRGAPLSVPSLLGGDPDREGRVPLALVYLAHLGERERMFALASILEAVVRWMRKQRGTGGLRLLIYVDEVFGFLPPHPKDPASKGPLLTLLKQARAFGVGLVLATQNPVDLDYKALSNASTWFLGRLATERDRERVREALRDGEGKLDQLVAQLPKRHFILHRAGSPPVRFRSRFVMSYLRGPLTRVELPRLVAAGLVEGEAAFEAAPGVDSDTSAVLAGSPVRPALPPATPERFLGPRAPGIATIHEALPAVPIATPADPPLMSPLVFARVRLRFDDRRLDLEHRTSWLGVGLPDPQGQVAWPDAPVEFDPERVSGEPPSGARYLPVPADLTTANGFRRLARELARELQAERAIRLWRHRELDLVSAPGETHAAFAHRVEGAAEARAEDELATLRDRYAGRLERLEERLARATGRLAGREAELAGRKREEILSAGESILGFLFGRRSLRGLSSASRRRRMTESAASRVDQASGEVDRLKAEMVELSSELEDRAAEIEERARQIAAAVEEIEVGLERDDVQVEMMGILWCAVRAS